MGDRYRCIQVRGEVVEEIDQPVVVEERFCLELNGRPVAGLVASPDQLKELGAGYVVSEGLASGIRSVAVDGNRILVSADARCMLMEEQTEIGSSGGVSFRQPPPVVTSRLTVTPDEVLRITRELETDIWRETGAVHCAVLYHAGSCVVKSSDVGRHNTVDKVIGWALLNTIDPPECVIGCTGRQPEGMIRKYANAGVPIVISRAASTDKGIALAGATGVTLVGFSRGDRFSVYTHPWRIRGIAGAGRNGR